MAIRWNIPSYSDCTTAGSAGFLPAACNRCLTGVGTIKGVSVPMHVFTPSRWAKVNTSPRHSPIRSNKALHCSGDIFCHGYVPRM